MIQPHEKHPSRQWVLLSALVLGLPILLLFGYNYSSFEINVLGTPLKKINPVDSLEIWLKNAAQSNVNNLHKNFPWSRKTAKWTEIKHNSIAIPLSLSMPGDSLALDSLQRDSLHAKVNPAYRSIIFVPDTTDYSKIVKSDSSHQRVLFMGDSQAGGLLSLFNDYCVENGHELVATHIWNSAQIFNYGYSTKADELIKQFQPTLIVIVLGLNEMYARDIPKRTQAANLLRSKLGDIPYLWIGPANYMEDYGINKVYEIAATPERYVVSKYLDLPRGSDTRHPSREGYKIWMQHIARFVQSNALYDFQFETPKKFGHRISGKVIHANAATDRGY
jgi:hypothetical protein